MINFRILLDGIRPETNFVRKQDVSSLFTYVAGNDIGEEFLLKFFFEHWEDIKKWDNLKIFSRFRQMFSSFS